MKLRNEDCCTVYAHRFDKRGYSCKKAEKTNVPMMKLVGYHPPYTVYSYGTEQDFVDARALLSEALQRDRKMLIGRLNQLHFHEREMLSRDTGEYDENKEHE